MNSRFIASLAPVSSIEGAKAFVASIKAEFPDARHHVSAWILGGGNSVSEYCTDDGEPSGTAGRPLLAVIKGSGLGDVAAVVTRYFGGTLLGTGGLVKAYSEAGKAALAKVDRATLVASTLFELSLPYPAFDRCRALIAGSGGEIEGESFAEAVSIRAWVADEAYPDLASRLVDACAGSAAPVPISRAERRKATR
jgi:uncharacterized YigZ family protein